MAIRGAYGFVLHPLDGEALPDLGWVPDDAPGVAISRTWASSLIDVPDVVEDGSYRLAHRGGGILEVERAPRAIGMTLPVVLSAAAVVHPLLTTPLAYLAYWRGDLTVHGGAFVAQGRAWILSGEREAGKSSLLTALGRRGHPIVADDLVVVGEGIVRAGPACIDLRPDTARRYPEARSLGFVSGRERHRLAMPPAAAEVPYGGTILLEWHDGATTIEELPLEDRLALIDDQHYAGPLGPPHPKAVFDALAAGMWRLRRRRDWSATDEVLDHLLAFVASLDRQ